MKQNSEYTLDRSSIYHIEAFPLTNNSFRIAIKPNPVCIFGLWEETQVPGEKIEGNRDNVQTPDRTFVL